MSSTTDSFNRLYEIIKRLRAPDGCPWDQEQTPLSMRGNLIEESYECVDAISEKDPAHVKEELGDVFLLATMISYMYEQEGTFSVSDALETISDKLVRRHPHVFGTSQASTSQEVLAQWQDIKVTQEGRAPKNSILDEVPKALPPLERAYKLQKKAAKVGFDWLNVRDVWQKAQEELDEAFEAGQADNLDHLEEELGDLLFSIINIVRFLGADPGIALQRTIAKFDRRFRHVEQRMKDLETPMSSEQFALMDSLWDEAKQLEKKQ